MKHFNGNLPVSIDVETTGFVPGYHDIIQIGIVILDSMTFKPVKTVIPCYLTMKPKRPHTIDHKAMHVTRINFAKLMQRALDPWDAADIFEEWFENLKRDTSKRRALLPEGKKLLPIAQNWCFDRCFVIDWLDGLTDPVDGEYKNFDSFFHPWYRDTLPVAQYLNDKYAMDPACPMDWKIPFPKCNLPYLCSQLKVKNLQAHDALQDCIATAKVYRLMIQGRIP
jgi:DNA polymerase III epsilon subunit-like protein